ncbi:glycosyltransferase [Helicobacter jaachi]|uniref:Glycosyltransferase n=1 Tax=Helicobacter jaachi TaxID=1677920 RepID=A0A4U8TC88_9HELI|nr:glycosyltransferase family 2 protein [Helicobacter jaachi]TLD96858.1 glycosyltransferase [Helicobacter jaachi]
MSPKISIITATFNVAHTIKHTLDSVIMQDFSDFEHIIIDGKSSDNTLEIIESYRAKYAQKGIALRILSERDNGIYDAMNKGLKHARGQIVGFLNADDFFASNLVLRFIAWGFDSPRGIDILYANVLYVNAQHKPLRNLKGREFSRYFFALGLHPPHPSFYVKRRVYEEYGGFDLTYNIAADYEIMLRFLQRYRLKSLYINECFVKMRSGGTSNASLKNILRANMQCMRAWRQNHHSYKYAPLSVGLKILRKCKDKLLMFLSMHHS